MIVSRPRTSSPLLGPALLVGACLLILVLLGLVLSRPEPMGSLPEPEAALSEGDQARRDSAAWADRERERQAGKATTPPAADR